MEINLSHSRQLKQKKRTHKLNKTIKSFIIVIFAIIIIFGCNRKAGPINRYFKKDGLVWQTSKIYGYPNGKRKIAQIDTYQNGWLNESKVYYEIWPNLEWKFVSKNGFVTWKNGEYLLVNDSIVAPDNLIYKYFDKNIEEQVEVYKDGKRIKYTLGYHDGYEVKKYVVYKPGIYKWKDGKEYFEREFTEEEWERYRELSKVLNKKRINDTLK